MKRVLYLGLLPPKALQEDPQISLVHYPVIQIVPRSYESDAIRRAFLQMHDYTHLLFTSKSAVTLFVEYYALLGCEPFDRKKVSIFSVGRATTALLEAYGIEVAMTAQRESSEGVVEELRQLDLSNAYFFWPHSAGSRPVITDFFEQSKIAFCDCVLYDTIQTIPGPKPDLAMIDEILFTSPSTVDGFLHIFGEIPRDKQITPIGEVTQAYLVNCYRVYPERRVSALECGGLTPLS